MASVSTAVRPGRAVRVPIALDAGITAAADVPGIDRAVIVVRALDALVTTHNLAGIFASITFAALAICIAVLFCTPRAGGVTEFALSI